MSSIDFISRGLSQVRKFHTMADWFFLKQGGLVFPQQNQGRLLLEGLTSQNVSIIKFCDIKCIN